MNTANDVIRVAVAEEGYLEKKSLAMLDDKTANAGTNNYTKYARDVARLTGINAQGQPWCAIYVIWCFIQAFGLTAAKSLLGGGLSAWTPTFANNFKVVRRWYKSPKAGDVIFFKNALRINHVGIVTRVDSKYVYTVEGNTSGASTVVANGGGVHQKKYALNLARIAGYGRPAYDESIQPNTGGGTTHMQLNYQPGQWYTVRTAGLNVRTKKATQSPSVIPTGKVISVLKMGNQVQNQATARVGEKIWMYIGLDSKKREMWACADSGTVAYIS